MSAPEELLTLVPLAFNPDFQQPTIVSYAGTPPSPFSESDLAPLNQLARILLTNPNAVFPPPPTPQPNERSMKVARAKEEGNKHFRKGEWQDAIKLYTLSADLAASRPVFESNIYARDELALTLSNRSAAYMSAGEFVNALVDADAVIAIKRPWVKGHFRRGKALAAMGRLEEAREALLLGLQFDPTAEVSLARF
jgi:translocation protein SEC72